MKWNGPAWENIDCSPLYLGPLWQRPLRIWGDCSHWVFFFNELRPPLTVWKQKHLTHKNPWPMLMIGWTGEAAAASFTIVLVQSVS